eukprot:gene614-biopygen905
MNKINYGIHSPGRWGFQGSRSSFPRAPAPHWGLQRGALRRLPPAQPAAVRDDRDRADGADHPHLLRLPARQPEGGPDAHLPRHDLRHGDGRRPLGVRQVGLVAPVGLIGAEEAAGLVEQVRPVALVRRTQPVQPVGMAEPVQVANTKVGGVPAGAAGPGTSTRSELQTPRTDDFEKDGQQCACWRRLEPFCLFPSCSMRQWFKGDCSILSWDAKTVSKEISKRTPSWIPRLRSLPEDRMPAAKATTQNSVSCAVIPHCSDTAAEHITCRALSLPNPCTANPSRDFFLARWTVPQGFYWKPWFSVVCSSIYSARGGHCEEMILETILQLAPRSRPVGQRIGTWDPSESQGIPMGTKGRWELQTTLERGDGQNVTGGGGKAGRAREAGGGGDGICCDVQQGVPERNRADHPHPEWPNRPGLSIATQLESKNGARSCNIFHSDTAHSITAMSRHRFQARCYASLGIATPRHRLPRRRTVCCGCRVIMRCAPLVVVRPPPPLIRGVVELQTGRRKDKRHGGGGED